MTFNSKYNTTENEVTVTLDRRDWFRAINAMHKGIEDIPDEDEREYTNAMIDEIIDQAEISVVEMLDLNMEFN